MTSIDREDMFQKERVQLGYLKRYRFRHALQTKAKKGGLERPHALPATPPPIPKRRKIA